MAGPRDRTFRALALDYDGTLADDGAVSSRTLAALRCAKELGCKLVLVTGRELRDLTKVFPEVEELDVVVAENGAVLYTPRPPRERLLASPPPNALARELRARGVAPLSVGRVIVATRAPYEQIVRETIRELGLDVEIILNKGAVMVLPSGVGKASGLYAALAELGVDASEVVGVGDAENDHGLLDACGVGVAVANAVPALKEQADVVTREPCGAGVVEVVDDILIGGRAEDRAENHT